MVVRLSILGLWTRFLNLLFVLLGNIQVARHAEQVSDRDENDQPSDMATREGVCDHSGVT